MEVNVHFLTNQLLPSKLSAVKGPDLVAYRGSDHSKFKLYLSSVFLGHLEDVAVKDIADLSNKIILGIDECQNFTISAENSLMSLFGLSFSLEIA